MKSSKLAAAVVAVLLVGSLFAGTAAAVESDPTNLPDESEAGTDFEATFEITELFSADGFETWTLAAETELTNTTWTIWTYNQAGSELDRTDIDGQTASTEISLDDDVSRVEVRVRGTTPTPTVDELSYQPPHQFVAAAFTQEREGGTNNEIATHETHHYTGEGKEAREAIESAEESVEGSGSDEAQSSLDSAISAYEGGNFENAIDLAGRAENEASQSQLIRNVLIGAGVVIALVILIGGGYRIYKSRQQDTSRLR
jgi:hypothetical protein